MNLRRSRSDEPDVNLTPLIDVVFILLLFFMVSTTFQRESEINIELPEASAEPVEERDETLEIVIDAEGHYFIDEQQVVNTELETLKQAIEKFLGERSEIPVVIRADRQTPYESVVRAMDATAQLGLLQMSLATSQPESAGE
ncbi:MAG: biopolymer transporter ExbD [Gammaproteobacteria bacterium]|nr:MAG: biopolymer transporter ExbD [Gammaproteobacteria bacterium]